jgi:hypothetical protein
MKRHLPREALHALAVVEGQIATRCPTADPHEEALDAAAKRGGRGRNAGMPKDGETLLLCRRYLALQLQHPVAILLHNHERRIFGRAIPVNLAALNSLFNGLFVYRLYFAGGRAGAVFPGNLSAFAHSSRRVVRRGLLKQAELTNVKW